MIEIQIAIFVIIHISRNTNCYNKFVLNSIFRFYLYRKNKTANMKVSEFLTHFPLFSVAIKT